MNLGAKLNPKKNATKEHRIYQRYKTYISHTFLGYLFNLYNSNICRLFKVIEPLLAGKITINKDRSLTSEKLLKILADVTEIRNSKTYKTTKEIIFW